eukprot:GEMP01058589.1.p1 GENE.GEMP01058589.1~~GEMP01058589.1.p1  ORF type:complete len:238 (+),score=55.02 GEMP01058589.1:158-871(+)
MMRVFANLFVLSAIASAKKEAVVDDFAKLIECEVCEIAVVAIHSYIEDHLAKKVSEDNISDLVEGSCSYSNKQGRWIGNFDIIQQGTGEKLRISDVGQTSICRKNCRIMQRACDRSVGQNEETLVALLVQRHAPEEIIKKVCVKACERNKKLAPKGHGLTLPEEEFLLANKEDLTLADQLAEIKSKTGLNLKYFSPSDQQEMDGYEKKKFDERNENIDTELMESLARAKKEERETEL